MFAVLPGRERTAELDLASRPPRSSSPAPLAKPERASGAGPRDAHLLGQARLAEEDARGPGLSPACSAARPAPPPTFPGEVAGSDGRDEVRCLPCFLSGTFGHRHSLRPDDGYARVRGAEPEVGGSGSWPERPATRGVKSSGILLERVTFANTLLLATAPSQAGPEPARIPLPPSFCKINDLFRPVGIGSV